MSKTYENLIASSLVVISTESITQTVSILGQNYDIRPEQLILIEGKLLLIPQGVKIHKVGLCFQIASMLYSINRIDLGVPLIKQLLNGRSEDIITTWNNLKIQGPLEQ